MTKDQLLRLLDAIATAIVVCLFCGGLAYLVVRVLLPALAT